MMENRDFYDIWEDKLDEIFRDLGISYGTKGELYLRELVAWYRPGKPMCILYQQVGQVVGADPRAVERNARAAILRGCSRLGYSFETWNKLFGSCISPSSGAPTLAEFVRRVRREVCGRNT